MSEVTQHQVVEYIKGISVLELSQLVKALESELGVSAERLLSPFVRGTSHGRIERVELDRLGEIVHGPTRERLACRGDIVYSREHQDRKVGIHPECLRQHLQTRHLRHPDIAQQHVEILLPQFRERRRA